MTSHSTYDTIIIGGGVVGASAAYHLTRAGAKTLLLDTHDIGRATDAGAGIIAPETSGTGINPVWFPFSMAAGGYYPTLIAQLHDEQAGDTSYRVCGELIVAADEDELDAYAEKKRVIYERQQKRGLPTSDELYEVSPEEARELFPPLKNVLKALYFKHGARVDGRRLTGAMLTAAQHHSLHHQNERAEQLIIDNRRVTGVRVQGEAIHAGNVIIAGGAWSVSFGTQLGHQIAVEPQRGQIIHLQLPDTDTSDWAIVEAFHGHYMVAWHDRRVVAGATRETGSGFVPQTTAAGVHQVLGEALRVAPGLTDAIVAEVRVGLRPSTRDNMPVLGGVPNVEGIYISTGHGASGLQLGPFSGKLAADWALGKGSEVDISAFSIQRWD